MNWFRLDPKKLFFIFLVLSLPLLSINLQKPGENPWILRPFSMLAGMTQNLYMYFSNNVTGTTATYLNLIGIKKRIASLESENALHKATFLRMNEVDNENIRLNKLLEFQSLSQMQLLPARVIGLDIFAERRTIRINKGSKHNIKKGMAVIHPKGVVGYVLKSNANSSVILLLTDRYAVIDGRIQRSRARGLVKGSGPHEANLNYLQRTDSVEVGDLVVTSGLDGIFPKGFPIAKVTSVKKQKAGITQEVKLQPVILSSRVEELFVIVNSKYENFEKLSNPDNPVEVKAETPNEKDTEL